VSKGNIGRVSTRAARNASSSGKNATSKEKAKARAPARSAEPKSRKKVSSAPQKAAAQENVSAQMVDCKSMDSWQLGEALTGVAQNMLTPPHQYSRALKTLEPCADEISNLKPDPHMLQLLDEDVRP
jgi:hypothetical protein